MVKLDPHEPLKVISYSGEVGNLDLPLDRVLEVTAVLDRHPIRYFVVDGWVTIGDSPRFTTIHFRRGNDYEYIQAVLDAELNASPTP